MRLGGTGTLAPSRPPCSRQVLWLQL